MNAICGIYYIFIAETRVSWLRNIKYATESIPSATETQHHQDWCLYCNL